jgi:dTDP-4-dehydrorhamnose reductase
VGRVPAGRSRGIVLKVLVTGGAGLVAGHLLRAAPSDAVVELTWHVTPAPPGPPAHRVDLTDRHATLELLAAVVPDVVVHTAYAMGDRASIVDATRHVAEGCAATGASLVHLSTDVVFSGRESPYVESDSPDPITDYGRWKAQAEQLAREAVTDVCITRTSLVVSLDPPDPATRWLVESIEQDRRPTLFTDEWRTPVRADDLAGALWALVAADRSERAGIWHLPGPERLSRWQLGERIASALDLGALVDVARPGSILDHPVARCADLSLRSERRCPGSGPAPVP